MVNCTGGKGRGPDKFQPTISVFTWKERGKPRKIIRAGEQNPK